VNEPLFAVVGHVNRGKSSIVSTLAADESVAIDAQPGTTRRNHSYPLRVAGELLYTLVDTPGFERARHALAWLRERETRAAERPALLRRFVAEHSASGEFPQECELLRPILAGGAILYVVDGSVPLSAASEAEIEILRWTGQPRMALINPIGPQDHGAEWRAVLGQSFSLVRTFHAQQADLAARLELLRALGELVPEWRAALERALAALLADRAASLRECAGLIADALAELVSACEEQRLGPEEPIEPRRGPLAERLLERLRRREQQLRADVRRVYLRAQLEVHQPDLERVDEDLFATDSWNRLGLSRVQLALGGGAAGALFGGGIDVALGGSSLLAGAALGGALGVVSTLWAWQQLAQVRVFGAPFGGRLLRAGPVRDPNFAWVVLDRALILHAGVAQRAHARRTPLQLAGASSAVRELPASERARLGRRFERLRRLPGPAELDELRQELARDIEAILRHAEPLYAGVTRSEEPP
jgi:hypothetical protein